MDKELIKWNLINSVLAGLLVGLGAFSDGNITLKGFLIAVAVSFLIAIQKFKEFWKTQTPLTSKKKMFSLV